MGRAQFRPSSVSGPGVIVISGSGSRVGDARSGGGARDVIARGGALWWCAASSAGVKLGVLLCNSLLVVWI